MAKTVNYVQPRFVLAAGALAALMAVGPVEAQTTQSNPVVKQAVTTTQVEQTVTVTQTGPDKPDADMQQLLKAFAGLKPKPIEKLTAEQARKQPTMADAVKALVKKQGGKMPSNSDIAKDSSYYVNASGDKLPVTIYYPKSEGEQPIRPVVLYFHGGGWVIANTKVYESSAIALARKLNAVVVAPEYRMAPEDKFPAAHEDAFAAYRWVLANAKEFHGDVSRIAVVGESAGGNLAANVGIMARDAKITGPVALGLIYPVAGTDMTTPSYKRNEFAKPLNKAMMAWFVNHIVSPQDKAKVLADPRLDLIHANLTGLPPTTVITAGIDPLQSDGEMLADKLREANVPTSYRNFSGVTHEFFGADAVLGDAREAQDYLTEQMRGALTR